MSYLKFNKSELVNLEYSLQREVLSTNRKGGYCNTTIVGCNTRKYHGLFVLPIEKFGWERYVLLSSVDETLIQHEQEFNLGIKCYGSTIYEPRGHKYIRDFELDRSCDIIYRVGGMIFKKSLVFLHNKEQLLIKYTLIEAHSPTTLRLKPFLAFRDIHSLTKANSVANTSFEEVDGGCSFKMYDGFPNLVLQISRKSDFIPVPDWYYDVVYKEEERRGFDYKEDLFNPGYFELPIKKGESVILSISTQTISPKGLSKVFENEVTGRMSRGSYEDCLKLAAKQFVIKADGIKELYSGFTWLGRGLRETLLALPGITIMNDGDTKTFDELISGVYKKYDHQLFYGSKQVDASLWLFWVAQQYSFFSGDEKLAWKKFSKVLKLIINSFIDGGRMGVSLNENGLLWAQMKDVSMTWMNAYSEGLPITERGGYQVETNALWYNALSYVIEMESKYGKDKKSILKWGEIKSQIDKSFLHMFWVENPGFLADYVDEKGQNTFVRPNQLFACSLNYSPISDEAKAKVLYTVKRELLTSRGIRTLAPKNPLYKGIYDGNQYQRDHSYHQGSTRVWLLQFYIEASLKLFGSVFVNKAEELVNAFEEDITVHGVGSICELYDGDPPHFPHGAISSSVAVSGILRAKYFIKRYKEGGEQ